MSNSQPSGAFSSADQAELFMQMLNILSGNNIAISGMKTNQIANKLKNYIMEQETDKFQVLFESISEEHDKN